MHLLITGGAGFVGAAVAAGALEAGHHVTVLDDLSSGHADVLPGGVELVVGDVRDRSAVDRALTTGATDGCVHLAALIDAAASQRQPDTYRAVNEHGTEVLLERLTAHEVDRVVLASSAAVYGDRPDATLTEHHRCQPSNVYGETKLAAERSLARYRDRHGLRTAALRYFNVAGADRHAEAHEPETHLVPIVLDVAAGTRPAVTINGDDHPTADGTPVRDLVHVADVADATLAAVHALATTTDLTCNVGSGHGVSVQQVVDQARDTTARPVDVRVGPRRPGDPSRLVADVTHACAELG